MTWKETLETPAADVELRFRKGSKREPSGEVTLAVRGDGVATLELRRGSLWDRHEAVLARSDVHALFAALAATGYPQLPGHTVPPGPGMVSVEVRGGPEEAPAMLHRSFLRDLHAWGAVVARLDALCERLETSAR